MSDPNRSEGAGQGDPGKLVDTGTPADPGTPAARSRLLKALALEAGFSRAGVARAHAREDDQAHLERWLAAGMHGEMRWLEKDPARRADPGRVVPGARSVLVLALDYDSDVPRTAEALAQAKGAAGAEGAGPHEAAWISRYAWGTDYHLIAERRLKALTRAAAERFADTLVHDPEEGQRPFDPRRDFRWSVDYGPVLERRWAEEAGLGWQGKHSLLVDPQRGSFFFLATVITSLELAPDQPVSDHCGSCTACMDACPSDAIVAERVVDARRCISYLTIEKRGPLSEDEQAMLHGHAFGCDLCQDACPFNRFSKPSGEPAFAPRPGLVAPSLTSLAALNEEAFRETFRQSPVKRTKLAGLQRNIAALKNAARGVDKPG